MNTAVIGSGNGRGTLGKFHSDKAPKFFCGDHPVAKEVVKQLAGPLTQARVLKPFALMWISLAGVGREIAFKLFQR